MLKSGQKYLRLFVDHYTKDGIYKGWVFGLFICFLLLSVYKTLELFKLKLNMTYFLTNLGRKVI